jgi:polyether ionophore transport system permease protein
VSAQVAVVRRTFGQGQVPTIVFALTFAAYAVSNVVGYRQAYPTHADRVGLAGSLGTTLSLRMFYGRPHDLLTAAGYAEWRVAGVLSIAAGLLGVMASVRALRAEEEAGRMELVLAGRLTHARAYAAAMGAVAAIVAIVGAVTFATLVATGLAAGGSLLLALGLVGTGLVFAGAGAVASQVASTRRGAFAITGLALGSAFLARVVADTAGGWDWLRWATPLGWDEELRPYTDPRPAALALPFATAVVLAAAAGMLAGRRDVGAGLWQSRREARSRLRLLGSIAGAALRDESATVITWLVVMAVFGLVVGSLSGSVADSLSASVKQQLQKLGAGDIATPEGFLAFYFVFFVVAISAFFCSQLGAARHEEADQRLETLLSGPLARWRWLGERLGLALATGVGLALVAGLCAWLGARVAGVDVSLWGSIEAGLNILPTGILFLGVATLLFGMVPRAGSGAAYGVLALAFLWDLVGGLFSAPTWLLDLTPFRHVGLVPIRPYPFAAAGVMLALGAAAALIGAAAFRRRDLTSA